MYSSWAQRGASFIKANRAESLCLNVMALSPDWAAQKSRSAGLDREVESAGGPASVAEDPL